MLDLTHQTLLAMGKRDAGACDQIADLDDEPVGDVLGVDAKQAQTCIDAPLRSQDRQGWARR